MKNKAVITGDITQFTNLSPEKRQTLVQETEAYLQEGLTPTEAAATFRGDSYQVLMDTPERALRKSIQLISWFRKRKDTPGGLGTRISIGIGSISYKGETVLNSDGPAFHRSGRNFDLMEDQTYLAITTADEGKNENIAVILNFVNKYIDKWSPLQAEVVYLHLEGLNQVTIARELAISQPSVNSRLRSAGWREIEPAIHYIISIIN